MLVTAVGKAGEDTPDTRSGNTLPSDPKKRL